MRHAVELNDFRGQEHREESSVTVAEAEQELKGHGGRVLLRYSGTEPKARLLLEGRESAVLEKWASKISEAVKRQVGV